MATMIIIPGVEHWSPCERQIMEILSDGRRHRIDEFHDVESPKFITFGRANVCKRVTQTRAKLKNSGYAIVTELDRRVTFWRLVRLLSSE